MPKGVRGTQKPRLLKTFCMTEEWEMQVWNIWIKRTKNISERIRKLIELDTKRIQGITEKSRSEISHQGEGRVDPQGYPALPETTQSSSHEEQS